MSGESWLCKCGNPIKENGSDVCASCSKEPKDMLRETANQSLNKVFTKLMKIAAERKIITSDDLEGIDVEFSVVRHAIYELVLGIR